MKVITVFMVTILFLTGCVAPFPQQNAGVGVNYQRNGLGISLGGNGSNQYQNNGGFQGQNQGFQQTQGASSCPYGSNWDGRGCAICPQGSVWDGRGCLIRQGVFNPNQYQPQPQQQMVCGPAAMQMSCPSIAVSGTSCRRCQ